jgi:hypothetical protein
MIWQIVIPVQSVDSQSIVVPFVQQRRNDLADVVLDAFRYFLWRHPPHYSRVNLQPSSTYQPNASQLSDDASNVNRLMHDPANATANPDISAFLFSICWTILHC